MIRQPESDSPVWTPDGPAEFDLDDPVGANTDGPAAEAAPTEQVALSPVARHVRPAAIPPKRSSSVGVLLGISALIAVGGVGFAVGKLAASSTSTAGSQNGNAAFRPDASGGLGGFSGLGPNASGAPGLGRSAGAVSGTVVSVGTDSFTVKLASGETVTISTASATTYHSQTSSSSTDLASGETVLVQTAGGAAPNASSATGTSARTATDVTITAK